MTQRPSDDRARYGAPRRPGADPAASSQPLSKREFEGVAALRYELRRFSRQTEVEARRMGLTPQQYFLLLAIKGYPGRDTVNITELAERLQVRHNAVIGLVNRAEERGLVSRMPSAPGDDRRVVRVCLTAEGEAALQRLAHVLREERIRVTAAAQAINDAQGL